jgi:hypothetical protein
MIIRNRAITSRNLTLRTGKPITELHLLLNEVFAKAFVEEHLNIGGSHASPHPVQFHQRVGNAAWLVQIPSATCPQLTETNILSPVGWGEKVCKKLCVFPALSITTPREPLL